MSALSVLVAAVALAAVCSVVALPDALLCEVRAQTDAGWVCGLRRWAEGGALYASFRAVPYAKQPVGERRFKELEPPEPWVQPLDATESGPVCHQENVVYGSIMQPHGFSEACIHANVHVPIGALPYSNRRRRLAPPFTTAFEDKRWTVGGEAGLPVLVFVHGGGFQGGSGDPDLHGPEYLVTKNVIVITFNYRLNAFGFLSLNSPEVPGNQGLRDQVTLLRWVQRNARAFGGDPGNVTLMGQSAGAAAVHLLTLSKATEGLFKRAFIMSGTGISGFYSSSPLLAQQLSSMFLTILGINSTESAADIHRQLIQMPVEKINDANRLMLDQFGLTTFVPTIESEFPGVTRILEDDPEVLVAKGRGKDVPLVIGFTDVECEVFRRRLDQIKIASKINDNPVLTVPANLIFTTLPDLLPDIAKKIDLKYYNGTADTDGFIEFCTDGFYQYPALKLAETRAASGGASVFLYRFSYEGDHSVLKHVFDIEYKGAAHIEDLTYLFRVNSKLGTHNSFPPKQKDDYMKDWMTTILTSFMQCSKPFCGDESSWPPAQPEHLQLQDIRDPTVHSHRGLTENEQDILHFFDSLRQMQPLQRCEKEMFSTL